MSTETTAGAARYRATGKRKSAVARVTLTPGSGEITCNGRPIDEFFGRKVLVTEARQPLTVTGTEGRFDVVALLHGGGGSGQAGALRHGIARALTVADEALRPDALGVMFDYFVTRGTGEEHLIAFELWPGALDEPAAPYGIQNPVSRLLTALGLG